jgi:hypothetical protein
MDSVYLHGSLLRSCRELNVQYVFAATSIFLRVYRKSLIVSMYLSVRIRFSYAVDGQQEFEIATGTDPTSCRRLFERAAGLGL